MGAYDGAGNFNRSYNWTLDASNGVDITPSKMDIEDNGFATALSNCVTRDGQGRPTADFTPATDNTLGIGSNSFRWTSFNGTPAAIITPQQVVKTSTTSRSSQSAPSDDPDLSIALSVGTWLVKIFAIVNGTTTGTQGILLGARFAGTTPVAYLQTSGATNGVNVTPLMQIFSGHNNLEAQNFPTISVASTNDVIQMNGVFPVTVAGNLVVSWSQNSPSTNATNLLAGSYLTARRLV